MSAVIASNRGASYIASTGAIAMRTWRKFLRTPQLVVVGTVQGAMFLLIFRYVFGGAIVVGGGLDYTSFLIPGFITTGIIFGGMASAAGIAEDLEQGFFDRLRSLPIPRGSVIAGRAVADTATATWGLLIMTIIGFAVGFRIHVGIPEALLAFAMLVVYAFVFEWVFITLGLYAGTAQAAQGMSLLLIPFVFVSSGFVPADKMPTGLRWVAEHQPITYMVESVRTLTVGSSAEHYLHHSASFFLVRALIWSVVLIAIFAPIAINRYRKG